MKQSIVWMTCLLLIAAAPLSAQIRINPKAGLNVSGLDTKLGDLETEARAGWNAGFDLRMGQGVVFFNPGVQYYNFSARLVQNVNSPDDFKLKDETTIQSLKLPLNIGLRLTGDNGLLGLHAKGGIVPTYVIGVNEKAGFDLNVEDLNRFTYGFNLGVGVDVLFLTADLTYEIGQTDFFKNAEGRNNVLTFNVGIKF